MQKQEKDAAGRSKTFESFYSLKKGGLMKSRFLHSRTWAIAFIIAVLLMPGAGVYADMKAARFPGAPESNGMDMVPVTGTLKDLEGSPIPEVWISMHSANTFFHGGAMTDANGAFTIPVPPGENYDIFVDSFGLSEKGLIGGFFMDADGGKGTDPGPDAAWVGSTAMDHSSRTQITVGENGISDIAIQPSEGARIHGVAIDTNGDPVADIWINAEAEHPVLHDGQNGNTDFAVEPAFYWGGFSGGKTDENGSYLLTVPKNIQVRISAWPMNAGLLGGFFRETEDSPLTPAGKDGVLTPNWNDATLIDTGNGQEVNIIFDVSHTISGRVVDENGAPLSGMWVNAARGEFFILDAAVEQNGAGIADEVAVMPPVFWYGGETDENGYYSFAVHPADDYRVSVSGLGIHGVIYYDNVRTWDEAALVDTTGGSAENIDFKVKMGPSIKGTVTGLKEGDVAYIETWGKNSFGWGHTMVTGTGGDVPFELKGLAEEGEYFIHVWAEGYLSGTLQQDGTLGPKDTAHPVPAGTQGVSIHLGKGASVSGTLTGMQDGDIAWIEAFSESSFSMNSQKVVARGTTGEFRIEGLARAADFRISVHSRKYLGGFYSGNGQNPVPWDSAALVSTMGEDVIGIEIAMTKGNTISGTITGLGEGDKVWIEAMSENGRSHGNVSVTGTGSAVDYSIDCLKPADDFRISIWSENYLNGFYSTDGLTDWENAALVDSTGNPGNIDFAMSKGNTISGMVTGLGEGEWAVISAWKGDEFLPFIDPAMQPELDMGMLDMWIEPWHQMMASVTVEGTGSPVAYEISGLYPAQNYTVQFWSKGYAKVTKKNVDASSNPDNIDFVASEGNTITGSISSAAPNSRVWVNAFSHGTFDEGFATVKTDDQGNAQFRITGLGFGEDYLVSAANKRLVLFYNQAVSKDDATPVNLSNGSAQNIDFDFSAIEIHTITGTISGASDNTFTIIDAFSENSGGFGFAHVEGNGDFSMEVPTGNYRISIFADGFAPSFYDAATGKMIQDPEAAQLLSVTSDVNLGTIELPPGFTLSGVVLDPSGEPADHAKVVLVNHALEHKAHSPAGDNGEYSVSGLIEGTYEINVWSPHGGYHGEVTIHEENQTLDITLEENSDGPNVLPPGSDDPTTNPLPAPGDPDQPVKNPEKPGNGILPPHNGNTGTNSADITI